MPVNPCYIAAGPTARIDKTAHVTRTVFPLAEDPTDDRFQTRVPIANGELGFSLDTDNNYRLYCAVRVNPEDQDPTWFPVLFYQGPPIDSRTGNTWTAFPRVANDTPY